MRGQLLSLWVAWMFVILRVFPSILPGIRHGGLCQNHICTVWLPTAFRYIEGTTPKFNLFQFLGMASAGLVNMCLFQELSPLIVQTDASQTARFRSISSALHYKICRIRVLTTAGNHFLVQYILCEWKDCSYGVIYIYMGLLWLKIINSIHSNRIEWLIYICGAACSVVSWNVNLSNKMFLLAVYASNLACWW